METIEKFNVAGIAIRTQNAPGKAEVDIPQLWDKFMQTDLAAQVPSRTSDDVYCVYTDYEGDHTQPYTMLVGFRTTDTTAPAGLTLKTIETGKYQRFPVSGNMNDNIVFNKWLEIWQSPIDRLYTSDFELYPRDMDYENAEADIFIAVK